MLDCRNIHPKLTALICTSSSNTSNSSLGLFLELQKACPDRLIRYMETYSGLFSEYRTCSHEIHNEMKGKIINTFDTSPDDAEMRMTQKKLDHLGAASGVRCVVECNCRGHSVLHVYLAWTPSYF